MTIEEAYKFKLLHPDAVITINGNDASVLLYEEPPVIALPMNIARKMLHHAGYLPAIEQVISQLSQEAQIDFEYADQVRSDNALVHMVLGGLGLSDAKIYRLFLDAKELF